MFRPTFDFVYFRVIKHEVKVEESLIARPDFTYLPNDIENGGRRLANRAVKKPEGMMLCRCLDAGPGRVLPSGATRVPPCKAGDIFCLDARVMAPGNVTNILGDDGEEIQVIGSDFINGVREDLPPWAKEIVPGEEPKIEPPAIVVTGASN